MTTSRSQTPASDARTEPTGDESPDETPELNVYEIHSERTVLTEPGNTDAWIATDTTVTFSE
ncbi:DUF7331 family protein [Halopenitus persicus]|uniref:DUF7331 family protein n=1 Tax=Halopenitus persicus TaxID=1048396 RepID=UPI000BBA5E88|nr:hypothetical protein [Halopenitus persicus]